MELIAGNSNLVTDQSIVARAALEYASYGWRVVPLYGLGSVGCSCAKGKDCKSAGKHPRILDWEVLASADEETVLEWWEKWPASNLGVALGAGSGIIDLEIDNEDGEALLLKMFDGNPPPTPMFRSGRGKHRLFKWRSELPGGAQIPLTFNDKHIGDLKLGNGEKGSQSVFPPSRHRNGNRYEWLLSPSTCEIAELPDVVVARLANWNGLDSFDSGKPRKTKEQWEDVLSPKREGEGRNSSAASYVGGMLRRLPALDDSEGIALMFQACAAINAGNIPPLDDDEFKTVFSSILRTEQQRRLGEAAELVMPRSPQGVVESASQDGSKKGAVRIPTGMNLVIVRDDPPVYELYHPEFKTDSGFILLTAAQLMNFRSFQIEAWAQGEYPIPDDFSKPWRCRNGIREQLMFAADSRNVNAATKRLATAADYLFNKLAAAGPAEKNEPDFRRPTRMENGDVWFRWSDIWRDGLLGGTVEKGQPSRLAHTLKLSTSAQKLWPARGKGRKRYVVFGKELMDKLETVAESNFDGGAHDYTEE